QGASEQRAGRHDEGEGAPAPRPSCSETAASYAETLGPRAAAARPNRPAEASQSTMKQLLRIQARPSPAVRATSEANACASEVAIIARVIANGLKRPITAPATPMASTPPYIRLAR